MFHQHGKDGFLYRYPRIQYRWDVNTGEGMIVGIQEGAKSVENLSFMDQELRLGREHLTVIDEEHDHQTFEVEASEELEQYRLKTPLLALNSNQYEEYMKHGETTKRMSRVNKIVVNQIASTLQQLGYDDLPRVYAQILNPKETIQRFKGVNRVGFYGDLLCNIKLPRGIFAVGQKVSFGYGWIY
jgi:hypothetical protein